MGKHAFQSKPMHVTPQIDHLVRSFVCNMKRPSVKQSMKWQVSSKLADLG